MTKAWAGHNRAGFKSHFGGWECGVAVTNEVHTLPRVHALMVLTKGHKKTLPIPPGRCIKSCSYGGGRLSAWSCAAPAPGPGLDSAAERILLRRVPAKIKSAHLYGEPRPQRKSGVYGGAGG